MDELLDQYKLVAVRLSTLEAQWDDMREQIKRGYQRMEKAHERLEKAKAPCSDCDEPKKAEPISEVLPHGRRFMERYNGLLR